MPPSHRSTRSSNEPPELVEGRIAHQQRGGLARDRGEDDLPLLGGGVIAGLANLVGDPGMLPDHSGGGFVLHHDHSPPMIGGTYRWSPRPRRLPGGEELETPLGGGAGPETEGLPR